MLDTHVRNGRVADGSDDPRYPDELGIGGKKRVVDVAPLDDAHAPMPIDTIAGDLFPGFVGGRSHTIPTALPTSTAETTTLKNAYRYPIGAAVVAGEPAGPMRTGDLLLVAAA